MCLIGDFSQLVLKTKIFLFSYSYQFKSLNSFSYQALLHLNVSICFKLIQHVYHVYNISHIYIYRVIKIHTNTNAVIVESCFLTNTQDQDMKLNVMVEHLAEKLKSVKNVVVHTCIQALEIGMLKTAQDCKTIPIIIRI